MKKQSMNFLEKLVSIATPSGFEATGQKLVAREMRKYADTVTSDFFGNVTGCINPRKKIKVMLAGHCDEVGYMIKYIDEHGFLRLGCIGAPRLCCASGRKMAIHTASGTIPGIMVKKRESLLSDSEAGKKSEIDDFWLDIGANSREEAEKLVAPGDTVIPADGIFRLAGDRLSARGFDDRIGVFIIVETLKRLKKEKLKVGVYGTATVQEETGGRGAQTAGFNLNPDIAIAIDVTDASDSPELDEVKCGQTNLGSGPVLLKGCNITPDLGKLLIDTAEKNSIPYQIEAAPMPTWTDADPLQRIRGGAATALVKIPLRYMHAPTEIISLADVENAIKLLVCFLETLDSKTDFSPLGMREQQS